MLVPGRRLRQHGLQQARRGHGADRPRGARQDLASLVTASGEIKPKNYINIGANAMGDLTEILVKEGDHVRKGQLLAKIEDIQPAADVEAQKATLSSAEADSAAAEAGLKAADDNIVTMQAALDHDKADLDRMKADFDRSQELYNEKLLAEAGLRPEEVHLRSAEGADPAIAKPRIVQARAQREQTAAQLAVAAEAHRRSQSQPGALQRHSAQARFLRPARRRGDQPARAGGRIRGARHAEPDRHASS